jgi:hypothetical protein
MWGRSINHLVVVALLLLPVKAFAQQEWLYLDVLGSKNGQIILSAQYVESHKRTAAQVCSTDAAFQCLDSAGFQFAYPRRRTSERSWSWKGANYTVTGEEQRSLLGKPLFIVFIDQAIGGAKRMRFVYSKEQGLLAFSSYAKNPTPIFVLQGACGFGAPETCKSSK